MGTPLPVVSGAEAAKAFEKLGWVFQRQKGSHRVYSKANVPANLSIPQHRELDRGMLRSLIRKAGITIEEFVRALD